MTWLICKIASHDYMIETKMTVTSKSFSWSSENLASLLPSNELLVGTNEMAMHERVNFFNMICNLHKNSIFYIKSKKCF